MSTRGGEEGGLYALRQTSRWSRSSNSSRLPSPDVLWSRCRTWKGLDAEHERIVTQEYYADDNGKKPRYYKK